MSDNDRTDRAHRIREMRDQSRGNDDTGEPTDADASGTDQTGAAHDGEGEGAHDGEDATGVADAAGESDTRHEPRDGESDEAGIHVPATGVDDVDVDPEELARQAGMELADPDAADDGDADSDVGDVETSVAGVENGRDAASGSTADLRVLEFTLGGERYCLDIEYIEEIVEQETITRVPNTPDYVSGVVDLRGQITTILDPKVPLDIDAESDETLIIVFDPDEFEEQGAIGWIVDDVTQVMPLREEEINAPPIDEEHVNGVVDRDGEFVILTSPEMGLDQATG